MHRTAARSLDFPVTFRVRGMDVSVRATLLQLGLSSCRLRTWRVLGVSENVRIDFPASDGSTLEFAGNVRVREQSSVSAFEYTIDLEALPGAAADKLAREAAQLVKRRTTTAA